jgi:hypothetical protein
MHREYATSVVFNPAMNMSAFIAWVSTRFVQNIHICMDQVHLGHHLDQRNFRSSVKNLMNMAICYIFSNSVSQF